MEKNHAEKLEEARGTIIWHDELPATVVESALTGAGYFLMGEVDRLSKLEKKVLVEIKKASDEITELNEDYQDALDADCDYEVFERIQREMGRAQAQLKVLAGLLK
jgi:hypothetical protein